MVLLSPINEVLPEPQHVVGMHAPTIPEGEEHFIAPKQNFAEVFDCMPFLGKEKVPKYHGNRRPVIVNGEQVWEEQHTTKSGVRSEFITTNNLHAESSPQDWFKAFLPIHDGSAKIPTNQTTAGHTDGQCSRTQRPCQWEQGLKEVFTQHSNHSATWRLSKLLACTSFKA